MRTCADCMAVEKFADHVEAGERVLTGQNPHSASAVGKAMAHVLENTPDAHPL